MLRLVQSLALAIVAACGHPPAKEPMTQADPAIAAVTDRAANTATVRAASERVAAGAPASVWSSVANDAGFPTAHRSIAAWQLLKRHVAGGAALRDVSAVLVGASWLDGAELEKIEAMGGELPVVVPEGGAAFVLRLGRGDGDELPDLGAYVALDRDSDAVGLRAALQGKPAVALDGAHVAGIAMFPESLAP